MSRPRGDRVVGVVLRGLAAGAAGTAAEFVVTSVEDRVRKGPAVYEPGGMAGRLARTWLHRRLAPRKQRWLGTAMRCVYGPSWGVLFALSRDAAPGRRLDRSWPLPGLVLGGAVLGFELTALPLTRATPPVRAWGTRQVLEDALNTSVYGIVVALVYRLLRNAEVRP